MKKKINGRTFAVIITLTSAIIVSAAGKNIVSASESRQVFIPGSYGRFVYDDGDESNNNGYEHDILIDAYDFAVIAENITDIVKNITNIEGNIANIEGNINSLNGKTDKLAETVVRKNDVINTLEEIKRNTEKDKAAGANAVKELFQAFQDGVNKIYNHLSGLGFTPITNSPDGINNAIKNMYDSRYSQGYTDGLGQMQSANANISYIYHQHTGDSESCGGCYTIPVICESDWDYTGQNVADESKCHNGHDISYRGDESNGYRCKYIMGYSLGCGMNTDTIISAVVEFKY